MDSQDQVSVRKHVFGKRKTMNGSVFMYILLINFFIKVIIIISGDQL